MPLFSGIDPWNVPALRGQEIANETGRGAASAFIGGLNAGTNKGQFGFEKLKYQNAQNKMKEFWGGFGGFSDDAI